MIAAYAREPRPLIHRVGLDLVSHWPLCRRESERSGQGGRPGTTSSTCRRVITNMSARRASLTRRRRLAALPAPRSSAGREESADEQDTNRNTESQQMLRASSSIEESNLIIINSLAGRAIVGLPAAIDHGYAHPRMKLANMSNDRLPMDLREVLKISAGKAILQRMVSCFCAVVCVSHAHDNSIRRMTQSSPNVASPRPRRAVRATSDSVFSYHSQIEFRIICETSLGQADALDTNHTLAIVRHVLLRFRRLQELYPTPLVSPEQYFSAGGIATMDQSSRPSVLKTVAWNRTSVVIRERYGCAENVPNP